MDSADRPSLMPCRSFLIPHYHRQFVPGLGYLARCSMLSRFNSRAYSLIGRRFGMTSCPDDQYRDIAKQYPDIPIAKCSASRTPRVCGGQEDIAWMPSLSIATRSRRSTTITAPRTQSASGTRVRRLGRSRAPRCGWRSQDSLAEGVSTETRCLSSPQCLHKSGRFLAIPVDGCPLASNRQCTAAQGFNARTPMPSVS